jgi:hypothetical protein
MDLKRNYKAIYEKIVEGKYKLIYEKNGRIYGSKSGIPTEGDSCLETVDNAPIEIEATPVANEEPINPTAEPNDDATSEDAAEPTIEVKEEPKKRTSKSSKQIKTED